MKETKNRAGRDIIVVGFALFSMFFGAGNVIFPPYLGMESGPAWLAGFSAYFIADIGLALAAMFALPRVGSSEAVLQRVGRVPAEILMCAIILCVRPDGRHPAHIRQHVRNGHRAESARCVDRGVLSAVFCTHPRAVHPRVRRGGHRGQGAHAAAGVYGVDVSGRRAAQGGRRAQRGLPAS